MTIRVWHIVLFASALVVSAIALAPAQLLFRGSEGVLTFQRAEGTIWNATLRHVDLSGLDGGDATVKVSPLGLLQGAIVSDVEFAGADLSGDVRFSSGFNGDRRIETSSLAVSGIRAQGFGRTPGTTRFTGVNLSFRNNACAAASGEVASDVLVKIAEQTGGQALPLVGNVTCSGQFGRLMLQGDAGGDSASALLDLSASGTGTWSVTYRTSQPQLVATLIAVGFMPDEQGGAFNSKGEVTWLPY